MTLHPDHPPAHDMIDLHLLRFLHQHGVVQDPDGEQIDAARPACFVGPLPDTPDQCVTVTIVDDDRDTDGGDSNPDVLLAIVYRSIPHDLPGLRATADRIFHLLHDRTHYELTADTSVILSRRVFRGPEIHDQNRRHVRADTYRLRPTAGPSKGNSHG